MPDATVNRKINKLKMTLKIFKINTKTGLGSPESGVKDAYSVIIFKQEAVHVKSKTGMGPLDPGKRSGGVTARGELCLC